jgi:hypothetical protein
MAAKRRQWGYAVWVVAGGVIGVPEIVAAADRDALPFTTISEMIGHLERRHPWFELVVVAAIVLAVYSVLRVPPQPDRAEAGPTRTAGGRLTLRDPGPDASNEAFDEDEAPRLFALSAFGACAVVGFGTWAAVQWWDDERHFQPAYVLYGSLALFWLVIPSLVALVAARDVPFPTLVHSVKDLQGWLRRRWPGTVGPLLAFLVGYVVLAGLVILLLHLALYPYPDVTRILNPNG